VNLGLDPADVELVTARAERIDDHPLQDLSELPPLLIIGELSASDALARRALHFGYC
jgi:hypothetical protein